MTDTNIPVRLLEWQAERHGLMLLETDDERGAGWVLYDAARDREVGPPWKTPGARMTLAEVDRALVELEEMNLREGETS